MRMKLLAWILTLAMILCLATPAFAASSGKVPIGFQVYDFEAGAFSEDGQGNYVGVLELTAYSVGYQWNKKQIELSNVDGDVTYGKFTEFAEAPSWSPYYIATQEVSIKQTNEEQAIVFTHDGPTAASTPTGKKPVPKSITIIVPARALPVLTGITAVSSDLPEVLDGITDDGEGNFSVTVATDAQFVRTKPVFTITDVPEGVTLTADAITSVNGDVYESKSLTSLGNGAYQFADAPMLLSPGASNDSITYTLYFDGMPFGTLTINFEPGQVIELGSLIESISITGLWPATGGNEPETNDARFVIESVVWDNEYAAVITVTAEKGYLFNGNYDALNIVSGWQLNNVTVGYDEETFVSDIKIKEIFGYTNMPNFNKFSLQVEFPQPEDVPQSQGEESVAPMLTGVSEISKNPPLIPTLEDIQGADGNYTVAVKTNSLGVLLNPVFTIANVPTDASLTFKATGSFGEMSGDLPSCGEGMFMNADQDAVPMLMGPGSARARAQYELFLDGETLGAVTFNFEPA